MRFRGANPVFARASFEGTSEYSATYSGVTAKTGLLIAIIAVVALYFGLSLDFGTNITGAVITAIVAPIIAIICVVVMHRMPAMAWMFAIVYAICEGVFLGFISAIYANLYGGQIILMALSATFGVFAGMLFLYSSGIIRVGEYFRRAMFSMLLGLIFAGLIVLVIALFGGLGTQIGYSLYGTIVVISVIVASLYLLVDFDNVTRLVEAGAPKETEWMLGIGLVVTIVWLYVEILRLIAILSRRR